MPDTSGGHKFRSYERWGANEPFWQNKQQLCAATALAGGEIAAAHYLNYLNPGAAMFFAAKPDVDDMARAFKLRKARTDVEQGYKISFMQPMMPSELLCGDDGYAHPLIVYAELIASKDPLNTETAQRLSDRYLSD